jgi:hypothetical protein
LETAKEREEELAEKKRLAELDQKEFDRDVSRTEQELNRVDGKMSEKKVSFARLSGPCACAEWLPRTVLTTVCNAVHTASRCAPLPVMTISRLISDIRCRPTCTLFLGRRKFSVLRMKPRTPRTRSNSIGGGSKRRCARPPLPKPPLPYPWAHNPRVILGSMHSIPVVLRNAEPSRRHQSLTNGVTVGWSQEREKKQAEESLEEKKANRNKMGKEPPGLDDKIKRANEVYRVTCT